MPQSTPLLVALLADDSPLRPRPRVTDTDTTVTSTTTSNTKSSSSSSNSSSSSSSSSGDSAVCGVLVGPEGGFTQQELEMCEQFSCVRFVSLGETVLRAETAAITAVATVASTTELLLIGK